MADLRERLGAPAVASADEAAALFEALTGGRACRRVAPDLAQVAVVDQQRCLGLAYLTTWIGVTDAWESVVPPRILRSVPHVRELLRALRDVLCADPGCAYWREHHDAVPLLKKPFGFPAQQRAGVLLIQAEAAPFQSPNARCSAASRRSSGMATV